MSPGIVLVFLRLLLAGATVLAVSVTGVHAFRQAASSPGFQHMSPSAASLPAIYGFTRSADENPDSGSGPASGLDWAPPPAVVLRSGGRGEILVPGGIVWWPIRAGVLIPLGALVRTGTASFVEIELSGRSRILLDERSLILLLTGIPERSWLELDNSSGLGDDVRTGGTQAGRAQAHGVQPGWADSLKPVLRMFVGRVWAHLLGKLTRLVEFSIETPMAVASVRGTIFSVAVEPSGKTLVSVVKGTVEVSSGESAELVASETQVVVAGRGSVPPPVPLSAREKEHWEQRKSWVKEQEKWESESDTGDGPGDIGREPLRDSLRETPKESKDSESDEGRHRGTSGSKNKENEGSGGKGKENRSGGLGKPGGEQKEENGASEGSRPGGDEVSKPEEGHDEDDSDGAAEDTHTSESDTAW